MAVSNSFNFTLNRDQLITKALLKLGAISSGQIPTNDEINDASNDLNLLLKAWQADGLQLWRTVQVSITPTSSSSYIFGDTTITTYQPIDILEVYRVETSTDTWTRLNRYSRIDFNNLSDHDSTGTPVNFYYNNGISTGTMEVWPIADSTFIANNTLEALVTKPFDDMDTSVDTLAFPSHWELAVVYGLAVLLAREYGLPNSDFRILAQEAAMYKKAAMDWDTEHTSIFITPDYTNNA